MANQDAAFGFRPARQQSGGQIRTEEANIANNYDTAIYTGQVVTAVTAGGIHSSSSRRRATSRCFRWRVLYWSNHK